MKVSEAWLREWVNPPLTGQQLAEQLTMAGLEVDARNPVAGDFDHVVVAEVLKIEPHPRADKLILCKINAGVDAMYQVVCGAANVREGLKVALALPGAHLPGEVDIQETTLRGQLSQGMLCSGAELGLEDTSEGIMELAEDAPIGVGLRDYLSLDDHVLDLDLTPNRADCFSLLGVAREVAALNRVALNVRATKNITPQIDSSLTINSLAPEACPQYCGRIIKDINPHASTPFWMKERLRRSGVRAVHPVVDVTNYVMLEIGQPMHAFDLERLDGNIQVRYSHGHESLKLLNGQELVMTEEVLLIADDSKPLAMAGVMGGQVSAVEANTTHIFLESAFFNPIAVAGVARQYRLCTDSSQRFERGVDPVLQWPALERATELLQTIVGGRIGPVSVFNKPEQLPAQIEISFNPAKVKQLIGLDLSTDEMAHLLESLGMKVDCEQETWQVIVPSYRFDVHQEVDLVEEIIRLYGYDNITAKPMVSTVTGGEINRYEQRITQVAAFLSHRGYHETISYSFVDPELQQALYPQTQALQLLNPISPELSQMRLGLWPGLIASLIHNIHRQHTAIKLFEAGVVFNVDKGRVREHACIAGLLLGEHGNLNWSESRRKFDFYDVKGDLQALFSVLHLQGVDFVNAQHPALHPGKSSRILLGAQEAGWLGVLHPRLLDALDINGEVMLFELSLPSLMNTMPVCYRSISKYPQVRRDLSLLVNQEISAVQIEQAIREVVRGDWLKSFDVFDVYIGKSIPDGKKSLAVALTFQDDKRTLVDAEINTIINAIIIKLNEKFAITLRD